MPKLLLVEDNEVNRDMLSRRLTRQGFDVVCAIDGPSAIAGARSGKYKPGVQLLEKAAALWHGAGKSLEFDEQLAILCRKYKLKRTLLDFESVTVGRPRDLFARA